MRLITTPSYYTYYFAIVGAIIVSSFAPGHLQAATITPVDGCFLRDTTTIYLTEPSCLLTIYNDSAAEEILTVQLLNLDPDGIDFTGATTHITARTKNTLTATVSIPVGTTEFAIAPWYSVGDDFYFVAVSDNQARGTVETNPIFEKVYAQISVMNPMFFTNSGDLVQGSDSLETLTDMFTAVQNTVSEAAVPMYPVPGNHDFAIDLGTYQNFFGSPNYSYDVGSVHFIGLSTAGNSSKGMVSEEQFSWLESEFMESTLPYSIIYFHHPLSVPAWGKPECCFADTVNRDNLADVLDRARVNYIINGHSQGYDYRYLTAADVSTVQLGLYQLITGGAGGNIAQPDGDYHFTLVHVTDHGIEHSIISESDFGLALEYENNSGRKKQAQATIENSSDIDIPYVRLKFRLHTTANSFLIQDETGQYYSNYQSHAYEDYTVVYVDLSLSAHTTHTVTVAPASIIYTGLTQTIDVAGIVTYSVTPALVNVATTLRVEPAVASTTLSAVTATPQGMSWIETPQVEDLETTYSLSDLSPNAFVQIAVNGQIIQRLVADTQGTIQFVYHETGSADRYFTIHIFTEPPQTVVTLPANNGSAQVRIFSKAGQVLGQWNAFDGALVADSTIQRQDITGDDQAEVIVYQPTEITANVRVYSLAGVELYRFFANSTPELADMTGDGVADMLISQSTTASLAVITYVAATASFATQTIAWPSTLSAHTAMVATADVTNDGIDEILVYDRMRRRLVALQYEAGNLVIVRSYRFNQAGIIQGVVAGYFQKQDQLSLAVLYQQSSGRQSLWYLVPRGARTWKRQFGQTFFTQLLDTMVVAALRPNQSDRLIVTTVTGAIMTYRADRSRWYKEASVLIDTNAVTPNHWSIGLINGGRHWPVKIVTTELADPGRVFVWQYQAGKKQLTQYASWYGYGESFPGGTLFAGN